MSRGRPQSSSWPLLIAAFACAGSVGATLLALMRGAFDVGEEMLASTESSRSANGSALLRADAVWVRAADQDEARAQVPTVSLEGRIDWSAEAPPEESVVLELLARDERKTSLARQVVTRGSPFRFEAVTSPDRADLVLHARFLFLQPVPMSLETSRAGIELHARVGACLSGRVERFDEAGTPELACLRGTRIRLEPLDVGRLGRPVSRVAELADDVRFEFGGLDPLARYGLIAGHSSLDATPAEIFDLHAGEVRECVLRLGPLVTIRGRVVDESGAPLAGARCRLETRLVPESDWIQYPSATGDDGAFEFTLGADERTVLHVASAGRRAVRLELEPETNRAELVVSLRATSPLTGRVSWPDGEPATGVRVCVDDESDRDAASRSAWSDDDGRFELAGLEGGPFTVSASALAIGRHASELGGAHERIATAFVEHVERSSAGVELVLRDGLTLRGRVLDESGHAWPRVRVIARPLRAGIDAGDPEREIASSFDSPDGAFELHGLRAGAWDVQAAFATDRSAVQRVTLGDVDQEIVVRFERGRVVAGRVLDADGRPLVDADVRSWQIGVKPEPLRVTRSDANGFYRFERVAPGTITLFARRKGVGESAVVLVGGAETDDLSNVELRMLPQGSFSLEVVDATRTHAGRQFVTWEPLGARDDQHTLQQLRGKGSSAESDRDGRLAPQRVPVGTYVLRVHPRATVGLAVPQRIEVRANELTHVRIELRAPIELRVLTNVSDAWCRVRRKDEEGLDGWKGGRGFAGGPATIPVLPGEHTLEVTWDGRTISRVLSIADGELGPIDVRVAFER